MRLKACLLLPLALLGGAQLATAQSSSANYVTEVVTDYQGFWRSGNGAVAADGLTSAPASATRPDNSHNLVSFIVGGVRYSTGVNNALLTSNALSYVPLNFQALPVAALGTPTGNTKVGLGQLYDGVDNGPSNPAPVRNLTSYLTDGPNGLNIGTGLANIPTGVLDFNVSSLQASALGDGVPDILVTQIADPAGSTDVYRFLDVNGNVVGNAVTVVYDGNFPSVGRWLADFYEASTNPMTLGVGFTKTERDLRLWSADLSQFGLTPANYSQVARFQIQLSGNSDVAFVAYNEQTATSLPVELTSFTARAGTDGQVQLNWRTASEHNAQSFIVEAGQNGHFTRVGEVAAAGRSTSTRAYAFSHQPATPGIWYYRLRQRDLDGTETLSDSRSVVIGKAGAAEPLQLLPNPARDRLRVLGAGPEPVQLLDATGRVLPQPQAEGVISLQGLPAGIYLVRSGHRTTRLVVE